MTTPTTPAPAVRQWDGALVLGFGLTPSEVLPLLEVSHAELDAMG